MGATPVPAALPFLRERILAVGALALLAPIPLFFTDALDLAVLLVYLTGLGLLLLRVKRGKVAPLSNTVLNLAGLAYIPAVVLDLKIGSQTLLKTMLHLLLFTAVLRLAAIRRERDFSAALILSGFLFLASVSTSFHYSILLYVALFACVAWSVLVKWGMWRDLAGAPEEWEHDREARRLPGAGSLALSVTAAFLVAIPLFVLLPRLRAPYIRGTEAGREITTGFNETVDPDLWGTLKKSDRVLLRITSDSPLSERNAGLLRLRTLALTRYEGRVWKKPARLGRFVSGGMGALVPVTTRPRSDAASGHALTIDLLPLGSRYIPYPLQGTALRLLETSFRTPGSGLVERDDGRNLRLTYEPERIIEYTAFYAELPPPDIDLGNEAELLQAPASDVLRDLVKEKLGGVDPAQDPEGAAVAIERYLKGSEFSYTLELEGGGERPVENFLLRRKKGHCQVFATAMAILLREAGIPTRFVTGFAGGEIGPFGRYIIVRGQNVHAWVEVWCGPAKGWLTFDPTPMDGIPTVTRVSPLQRVKQAADAVEFFYDRYILSFGQGDQVELIRIVREATGVLADVARRAAARAREALVGFAGARVPPAAALPLLLVVAAGTILFLIRRRRSRPWRTRGLTPASAAYRRLQRALERSGARLTPASAPAETLVAARRFGRPAAVPAEKIVASYLRESFGGIATDAEEQSRLSALVRDVKEAVSRRPAA